MYVANRFAEPRIEVLHPFIRQRAFGTPVRQWAQDLKADHLP
jgi:predicted FMN-binding regulatory protein PaiB